LPESTPPISISNTPATAACGNRCDPRRRHHPTACIHNRYRARVTLMMMMMCKQLYLYPYPLAHNRKKRHSGRENTRDANCSTTLVLHSGMECMLPLLYGSKWIYYRSNEASWYLDWSRSNHALYDSMRSTLGAHRFPHPGRLWSVVHVKHNPLSVDVFFGVEMCCFVQTSMHTHK
jgi:hypothetical protein